MLLDGLRNVRSTYPTAETSRDVRKVVMDPEVFLHRRPRFSDKGIGAALFRTDNLPTQGTQRESPSLSKGKEPGEVEETVAG
ncbi:hypothetical protein CDAR_189001 [Caerostris darwini]|uniref:Uncharacterized protein n=1 Tax=Caerostris darwini TaxID=1538125 RepID=A0AAV4QV13_9ARAC|nr:hypothetical protein CDAR_189001 [Caerostris darwini]